MSVAQCVVHLFALQQLHLSKLTEPFSQADAYRGHNVLEQILLSSGSFPPPHMVTSSPCPPDPQKFTAPSDRQENEAK